MLNFKRFFRQTQCLNLFVQVEIPSEKLYIRGITFPSLNLGLTVWCVKYIISMRQSHRGFSPHAPISSGKKIWYSLYIDNISNVWVEH
jgi:hypothetical protein